MLIINIGAKVSGICFTALDQLSSIKYKVNRLYMVKSFNLFPKVTALLEIESKYGETITIADIEGVVKEDQKIQARSMGLKSVISVRHIYAYVCTCIINLYYIRYACL